MPRQAIDNPQPTRYSPLQVILHWLSAVLVLAMLASGFAAYLDLAGKGALQFHQITGQILILVLTVRIALRLVTQSPQPTDHHLWERRLAHTVHVALYVCLIALAITGYVAASALGDTALAVPIDHTIARSDTGELLLLLHFALKWVLLALLALHLTGALKHLVKDRDDTLKRMTLPLKGAKE